MTEPKQPTQPTEAIEAIEAIEANVPARQAEPTVPLDPAVRLPLELPLRGSRLVEASAGTGKTWTIAALYVRLVLGHGPGLGRALAPGEILVMTFTKAATRELSDRIRGRLVEAAAFFRRSAEEAEGEEAPAAGRAAGAPPAGDAFLRALRDAFAPGRERDHAAWRLASAAEAMDDAAVHTIDAWCQRMLREHAFDSGCLFDEELQPNETPLARLAAQDWWRQQVYPLQGAALDAVLALWPDVASLIADVRPLIDKPPVKADNGDLATLIDAWQSRRAAWLADLKRGWNRRADRMHAWLKAQWQRSDCPLNKRSLGEANGTRWLTTLRAWAVDPAQETLDLGKGATHLRASSLPLAAGASLPADVPREFSQFEGLMDALAAPERLAPRLRAHALARIRQRLQQLKQAAGRYGHADLLERLDDALDEGRRGAHARELRRRIVSQYPAALIDEFQDTSPRQLSIFERVYRIAEDDPARLLVLIGDPKQSIYAFRGADIHSYLQARRATAGRHHALATNRRSTVALVQAVNTLFQRAEDRPGGGAFMFRDDGGGGNGDDAAGLPFTPVRAHGRAERLQGADGDHPALTFCVEPALASLGEHRKHFAELAAERIVALLIDPRIGFAGTKNDGTPAWRRVQPRDIAVLVRAGAEAELVQRALRRRGVASVYLSDKDSVFARPEAADLLRLVRAVAEPRRARLARAAFATRLLGRTLAELRQLATDEAVFDAMSEHLGTLHAAWRQQGVLAMVRRALHLFDIPARMLADDGGAGGPDAGAGERRLTDVLHLAELLEAASATVEGEPALVRWLAGQIESTDGDFTPAEDQVLRLESDAALVQVVTVHKAKGLQYAIAFVPFAWGFHDRKPTAVIKRDERTGTGPGARVLELAPDDADIEAHRRERLQEDLRLLYVALTRAEHALWVGAAAMNNRNGKACLWHHSALGRLVCGDAPREPQQIAEDLHALAAAAPGAIRVEEPAPDAAVRRSRWQPPTAAAPLPPARRYDGTFDRRFALASYSALVREAVQAAQAVRGPRLDGEGGADIAGEVAPAAPAVFADFTAPAAEPALTDDALPRRLVREDDEDDDEFALALPPPAAAARMPGTPGAPGRAAAPWHRFPRGAMPGNFLHEQLEWLAGEGLASLAVPGADGAVAAALKRRCERQGHGQRSADVLEWLQRIVAQPLPPLAASLADLGGPGDLGAPLLLPEMEFWLPATGLDIARLDALCREHFYPHAPRPPLTPQVLHGLVLGFADLVFAHPGAGGARQRPRHWVLDYKSNVLGASDADYTDAAMRQAMLHHRYDVQATLYLLALHRLLARRLGHRYDPARDLGGAIYYFLRGVGAGQCCQHLVAPPAMLHALEEMLR